MRIKITHYTLIFSIIMIVYAVILSLGNRQMKELLEEKYYLEQCINTAIDDATAAMIHISDSQMVFARDLAVETFYQSLEAALGLFGDRSGIEELKKYIPFIAFIEEDNISFQTSTLYNREGKSFLTTFLTEKMYFTQEDEDFIYLFSFHSRLKLIDKKGILKTDFTSSLIETTIEEIRKGEKFKNFREIRPSSFLLNDFVFELRRKQAIYGLIEEEFGNCILRHTRLMQEYGFSYTFNLPVEKGTFYQTIKEPGLFVLFQGYPIRTVKGEYFDKMSVAAASIYKREEYYVELKDWYAVYHKEHCPLLNTKSRYRIYYSAEDCAKNGAYPCATCISQGNEYAP